MKHLSKDEALNELNLLLKSTINELTCLDNLIDKIRQDITDHEFKQAA
jgi:hypothetical protein